MIKIVHLCHNGKFRGSNCDISLACMVLDETRTAWICRWPRNEHDFTARDESGRAHHHGLFPAQVRCFLYMFDVAVFGVHDALLQHSRYQAVWVVEVEVDQQGEARGKVGTLIRH